VIGTAKAWLNLQLTNYVFDATNNYVVTASGMDLFSNANNAVFRSNYNSGGNWTEEQWAAYQSTTITSNKDTA
jgi:hypothetical protein